MKMRFWSGRLFGVSRSCDWSIQKRLAYIAGGPLIPWVRFWRVLGQAQRHHWQRGVALPILLFALVLLVSDGMGEIAGYVFGPGEAEERVSDFEFHRQRFLNQEDLRV